MIPRMAGGAGAVVSMVTIKLGEVALTFPAVSVAVAVKAWLPSTSATAVKSKVQFPDGSAVVLPMGPWPAQWRLIVLPGSPVPRKMSVVSRVIRSFAEMPVSVVIVMIAGAAGAAVSMVTTKLGEVGLTFPTASVAVAVKA